MLDLLPCILRKKGYEATCNSVSCERGGHPFPTNQQGGPIAQEGKAEFDSSLAAKLGADAYGMKRYVMAFLKAGPHRLQDSSARAQRQKAHLKNIRRLAREGKLIIAGPFLDEQQLRDMYLFNVKSVEEARQLTATDPAVKAGSPDMELHPWYGSAALQEMLKIHERIERKNVSE